MKIFSHKSIISLVIISAVSLVLTGSSYALVPIEVSDIKINKDIFKLNTWATRCASIQSLAEKKIDKFNENKDKHYQTYVKLSDRLDSKVVEWEDMGYDVDEIRDDLDILQDKITAFMGSYDNYMTKLNAIADIDCDNTEAELTTAVKNAKLALKEVKQDVADVRNFYQTVLRPDILDLKKQVILSEEE